MKNKLLVFLVCAVALIALPLFVQQFGQGWVRIMATALLYVLLALGLNIIVGYAGLLDLGYVAFYAVGAYMYALLASPHLFETFPWIAQMFPKGLHTPIWLVVPLAAGLAACAGILLGTPVLKLRGDYLAIVTLRRDHPRADEQPGAPGQHHQRAAGAGPHRPDVDVRLQLRQAAGHRRLQHPAGDAVLLPVPGAGGGQRDHVPPARTQPHRPRLDGDP
jgi:Branched-chain amino acid transport system / permease component